MYDVGLTAPSGAFDCTPAEAAEHVAATGADGFEFWNWEDADLDAVADSAAEHGVEAFGTLAAGAGSNISDPDAPSLVDPESHEQAVRDLERSIEAAASFGGRQVVTTVGQRDPTLDRSTQQNALVDALRAAAPAAEDAGVTVVVEPLNTRVDHPGYFLTTTDRGAELVAAVDSPNVKLLFDVYHQQITEGDVIRRFRRHVDAIGHVHVADNPGRGPPGTGELAYDRIYDAIAETGYDGYVTAECFVEGDPADVFSTFVSEARR
ncbi:MAG: TIM barrel protein [Halobacteriaceae archaeon]